MSTPSDRTPGHQDGPRRSLRHAIGATVTVSAAVLALATPAATANAAPHHPLPTSSHAAAPDSITTHAGATTTQERNRISAYWTAGRMKLAGALVPEITPVPEDDNTPDDPQPLPPNTPDSGTVWTHGGAVDKNVGRLFFTFSDGYDASCTATVVASANRSTVLTAAHCLKGVDSPTADDLEPQLLLRTRLPQRNETTRRLHHQDHEPMSRRFGGSLEAAPFWPRASRRTWRRSRSR